MIAAQVFAALILSAAYVELTHREYTMPFVQFWRLDGKAWNDRIDPGILVR
jgi:hypothetical protein